MAALVLFMVGGALALAGMVALKTQAQQRMRFADALAAELTGSETVRGTLSRLGGQPTELTRGGITLQDLCFAGPRPQKGYVQYTPDIQRRLAWLESGAHSRNTGLAAPVASAVALTAVLAALGLAAVKVPYGQPFSTTSRPAGVPLAETASSSSGPAAAGNGQPALRLTIRGRPGMTTATVNGSPGAQLATPSGQAPRHHPSRDLAWTRNGTAGTGRSPAARYAQAVVAEQPTAYWQFNDPPGTARLRRFLGTGQHAARGADDAHQPGARPPAPPRSQQRTAERLQRHR